MIPYALGQNVEFKNYGPKLGDLNINDILEVS